MVSTNNSETRCFICGVILNNMTTGDCIVEGKSTDLGGEPVRVHMCDSCADYSIKYSEFKLIARAK